MQSPYSFKTNIKLQKKTSPPDYLHTTIPTLT